MNWYDTTVGELVEIKHGFAFLGEHFANSGRYVVLTPGNCENAGGFKSRVEKEKWYSADVPDGYLLEEGALLVVMTDLVNSAPVLGGAFFIPESEKYLHNQRLGLVTVLDEEATSKRFLYYLFNTHDYRGQVRGSASGATVRHTSPGRIKNCRVRIPIGRSEQDRIATVLSAYDDLIENNRRRIALLEEAARQLYKEWFVRLRFPGHEHVKIIDGLPEGWERLPLGDVLTLQRGFDLPTSDRNDGTVPVYGSTGIVGYHDTAKVAAPMLITGRSGSLGRVCLVSVPCWPLNTALWVREFKRASPWFSYFLLVDMGLEKFNGGASVPTLDRKVAHAAPVLLPTGSLMEQFDETARQGFELIDTLNRQNAELARARDLLLPKLMSGAIAV